MKPFPHYYKVVDESKTFYYIKRLNKSHAIIFRWYNAEPEELYCYWKRYINILVRGGFEIFRITEKEYKAGIVRFKLEQ